VFDGSVTSGHRYHSNVNITSAIDMHTAPNSLILSLKPNPTPQLRCIEHNGCIMSSNLLRTMPRASPAFLVRSVQQRAQGMITILECLNDILMRKHIQCYRQYSLAHTHPKLLPVNLPTSRNLRHRAPKARTSINPAPTTVQKTRTLRRPRIL
jgi:hypothetical protein